jgi:hypothetical protein
VQTGEECHTSVGALIVRIIFVFFAVRFCGIDCGALGHKQLISEYARLGCLRFSYA